MRVVEYIYANKSKKGRFLFSTIDQESIGSQFSCPQTQSSEYKLHSTPVTNPYLKSNQTTAGKISLLTDTSKHKQPTTLSDKKNE